MAVLVDWVKQTVSGTPGVGDITLSSAVSGYIRLQDNSTIVDGTAVHYSIEDGSDYEHGIGIYTASGTILTRVFIKATYASGVYTENPGTGLSLTSAAIVTCSPVSATHNFRGALVGHSTTQSIASSTTTEVQFNTEVYDTDGFHDNTTNNSRFTIPANKGIRKIRLRANIEFAPNTAGIRLIETLKNTTYTYAQNWTIAPNQAGWIARLGITTPVIPCTDGDYFLFRVLQNSGSTINLNHYYSYGTRYHWAAIEVVE